MAKSKKPITENVLKPKLKGRKLISQFHTLNKKLAQNPSESESASIQLELESLGGLAAYQRASLRGGTQTKGWGSATWVVGILKTYQKLKLLDVGAITGQVYERYPFLKVESIDLNSQSSLVQQQDFMLRPMPASDEERFSVVCLSLVVNFVGDPVLRGDMLAHTKSFLEPDGLVYLVLPLPCIQNSRYMTHKHLIKIMHSICFDLVEHHLSPRLAFYVFRLVERPVGPAVPKAQIAPGAARNNFSIVIA